MPRANPNQPLVICCELCGERVPTIRRRAWYDAIDHGLDFHLANLLTTPEYARRWLRVTHPATGRLARVAPTNA